VQRKAELRKLIGDAEQRRKGFAKEASALWIRYGFKALALKKIYLNTRDTDIRNVRLNEELGFVVEGVLRNEVLIDGTYHDVLRMGLWHTMPK
jgi:RimJ/RimL family protein N-acetyltransferase